MEQRLKIGNLTIKVNEPDPAMSFPENVHVYINRGYVQNDRLNGNDVSLWLTAAEAKALGAALINCDKAKVAP